LGDPNFPQASLKGLKTSGVGLIQSLYQTYSRLAFSHLSDRPIAIWGIEKRLAQALGYYAGFGVFIDPEDEGVLARYLLWHRSHTEKDLRKIIFPSRKFSTPSWSWMTYDGGIDYLQVPFGQVSWNSGALRFSGVPFESMSSESADPVLIVTGQKFELGEEDIAIYDNTKAQTSLASRCVIVGYSRRHRLTTFYALLIEPVIGGSPAYERIGIAVFKGSDERFSEVAVELRLR
jgi:hypothetical protein